MELSKQHTLEIQYIYNLRRGEKRLSKQDKNTLKSLKNYKQWGTVERFLYKELEQKMLKHSINIWKQTYGDIDKIIHIIEAYFTLYELNRIRSAVWGG